MQGFQYTFGDRPLEGYTIQRAVGRGGFGEVYYALSDAGREVALKAINGYEQIEVRGVSQCMNLKSPHLVSIFDIKQNDQGKTFVIMEYVNGPSLKELIEQSPAGLGAQKSAFFLRELAKGLLYLHERGIVHRDLKPGNVFYEDGYVKIGDYGLSKAIGVSRHSGQTITVGTVHYMAPEVGMGKYDKSIDIYALGVVLYEMLTGQVPFFGGSHGEILMKHLMTQPDLTGIEEPFATVIRKSMCKEPAQRYQSVQEMVEAIFGAEHVRNSVSCFSPDSLTMVAGRVAQKAAVAAGGVGGSSGQPNAGYGTYQPPVTDDSSDVWGKVAQRVDEARGMMQERIGQARDLFQQRMDEAGGRVRERYEQRRSRGWFGPQEGPVPLEADTSRDPLNTRQRITLAVLTAAAVSFGVGVFGDRPVDHGVAAALVVPLMSLALTLAHRKLARRVPVDDGIVRRIVYGGSAALAVLISTPFLFELDRRFDDSIPAMLIAVFLIEWAGRLDPSRPHRVNLSQAFMAGLTAWVLALMMDGAEMTLGGIFAGVSLTVQALAAYDPLASKVAREHAAAGPNGAARTAPDAPRGNPDAPIPGVPRRAPQAAGPYVGPVQTRSVLPGQRPSTDWDTGVRRVPQWARIVFLCLFVILCGVGILALSFAGMSSWYRDVEPLSIITGLGIGALMLSLFSGWRAWRPVMRSYWSGLVRPLIWIFLATMGLCSAIFMGNVRHMGDEETLIGLGFIIFPALLILVLAFVPSRFFTGQADTLAPGSTQKPQPARTISDKDAFVALLLSCAGFVGIGGLHRFYAGRYVTGMLYLVTAGLFGLGTVFDVVLISCGLFRDGEGLPLQLWMVADRAPFARRSISPPPVWPAHVAPDVRSPEAMPAAADVAGAPSSERYEIPSVHVVPELSTRDRALRRREVVLARRSWLLAALGNLLLLTAFLLGLFMAINTPALVAAGFPDPSIARDTEQLFGYPDWPRLVQRAGYWLAFGLGLLAAVSLLIARRRSGAAHTGRAVFAMLLMAFGLQLLHNACRDINWFTTYALFESGKAGPGIELIFDKLNTRIVAISAVMLIATIITLIWPERRAAAAPGAEGELS